jgi:hypothetical protein
MPVFLPAAEESTIPELSVIAAERVYLPPAPAIQSVLAGWSQGLAAYQASQRELQTRFPQAQADQDQIFGWTIQNDGNDGSQLTATTIVQDLTTPIPMAGPPPALAYVILRGVEPDQRIFLAAALTGTPTAEAGVQVHALGGAIGDATGVAAIGPLAGTFWQRFVACLRGSCASGCLGAVATCAAKGGGWAAFLACLAVTCGGCALKCSACAACDCTWWCKWAAGCCRP